MTRKTAIRVYNRRGFPKFNLERAVAVSKEIQDSNAGKPMKRLLLADAMGISPSSSAFKALLSCSLQYGLTNGTEKADSITLTELGRSIVAPLNDHERQTALRKAAVSPELFSRILGHYDGGRWPSADFLKNALQREFDVDLVVADECISILTENGKYAGFLKEISGKAHIMLDVPSASVRPDEDTDSGGPPVEEIEIPLDTPTRQETHEPPKPKQDHIFIAHGKNKRPLEQLKKVLDKFKISYKIAEEEPNQGRPISNKVRETISTCHSAILIFTADEELRDLEGNPVYRPSENVVHELGACSLQFGQRIVIFKEDSIQLPTNVRDIGYISFEKDHLDSKASELIQELIGFGILKITPA